VTCNKKIWGNSASWLWRLEVTIFVHSFSGTITANAQITPDSSLGTLVVQRSLERLARAEISNETGMV
jgi:hypothetical protein